jgi:hypothetical protein
VGKLGIALDVIRKGTVQLFHHVKFGDFVLHHWGTERVTLASFLSLLELSEHRWQSNRATNSIFWMFNSAITRITVGQRVRNIY